MNRFLTVFFFLSVALSVSLKAQQNTIIDDLEISSGSQGIVSVESDPAITALLGTPIDKGKEASDFMKISGFRIQVFMGSNPRSAKQEAHTKETLLNEKFPELASYVKYDAPNWKLYVGDFLTKDEAMVFRQKIQKAFPEFGKEVYTVIDRINVPIYQPAE